MTDDMRAALRQVIAEIAPDGFTMKVGTGQIVDGKKAYGLIPCDVAAFPAEILAWTIDRGLACWHAEKLNNVPVDGGVKYREAKAAVEAANRGEIPALFRSAPVTRAATIGDPVLARAVNMWIQEADARLDRLVKSAKGRAKPNAQEKRDYARVTAPFDSLTDAQGNWAIGKIASILKGKPERLEAAREAIAADALAADVPVRLEDLF